LKVSEIVFSKQEKNGHTVTRVPKKVPADRMEVMSDFSHAESPKDPGRWAVSTVPGGYGRWAEKKP
jgi:hypothetical protein